MRSRQPAVLPRASLREGSARAHSDPHSVELAAAALERAALHRLPQLLQQSGEVPRRRRPMMSSIATTWRETPPELA
jgi:hypothetical protein